MTSSSAGNPAVTIGVLTYGDYPRLARRTIESIRQHCDRSAYRLVVGANAVGAETRAYLEGLEAEGEIDRLILSPDNLNKCPMMRRMLAGVATEFFWWFDDDSYVIAPEALPERLRVARGSPSHHVMWGHMFFFGHENDFNYGTDVVAYVKRAPWYRGLEPPSWEPGGKGETDFQGQGTGDGRWFFITGGCWFIRTHVLRDLDWPAPGLIKRNDDVLLCEAIRQQRWECHDIGPMATAINQEPRRGVGEDQATMESQMGGVAGDRPAAVRYAGVRLLQWRVAHEMTVRRQGDELIVGDTAVHSYHLLRIQDERFVYRRVRLRCLLRPLPDATANFYVHHYGDIDVAEIALDGTIVDRGTCLRLTVERDPEGRLHVDLEYLSCHPTVSIGCSRDHHRVYAGDGREQFAILSVEVEALDATAELSRVPADERLTLVDVGAQEGLQLKWMLKADRITPVLFEPLPPEAEALRRTIGRIPGGQVVEHALADTTGPRTLFVTAASSCSSLREPNHELLRGHAVAPLFETVRQMEVAATRYDDLFHRHLVPRPDVIKIDVQGFEYEVLQGFGELLHSCIGVELEAHFYPVYKGQKLLGEIIDLLAGSGFVLRDIRPVHHFDGELVEVDALFTKRRDEVRRFPAAQQKKFTLLTDVWGLSPFV
jgi:FkbM family methyltransferase